MISLLPLNISLRFSYGRYHNSMILFISIISTIGVALGVAILIICLSAMNGFKRELNNRILSIVSHGEIEAMYQPWKRWNEILKKIEKIPGIIAAAPYINFTGLVEGPEGFRAIQIKGVNPKQEEHLSALPNFVHNDAWKNLKTGEHQVIVGDGVINALKIRQDKWVSVIIPNASIHQILQRPKYIRLHITGTFHINSQLDNSFAIVPLKDAQQYLNMDNSVTGIAIRVHDIFNIKKLIYDISSIINDCVYLKSWMDTYGYIYHDIQMIRTIIYLAMIIVIGVACFNIVSTLVMSVKDKSSDIAILRTLGAKNNLIRAIFVWYGLFSGLRGILWGMTIGIIISLKLTLIVKFIEKLIKYQFLSSNIYFIDFLPSEFHWLDAIYVLITAILLSLLASWYPAYRASLINPVNILHN